MTGPTRRDAALAIAAAALSACAQAGPPRLRPGAGETVTTTAAPVRLAERGARLRGWVETPLSAVPFAVDGADAAARPVAYLAGDTPGRSAVATLPAIERQITAPLRGAGYDGPLIALARPWASDPAAWRRPEEIEMAATALTALGEIMGFETVDVIGHSSGATVAFGLAQETRRVGVLVGASPPLALIPLNSVNGAEPAPEVYRQYDPVKHVAGLSTERTALVVDPRDTVVPPVGWRPWLDRALALGFPVTLVETEGGGRDRHATTPAAALVYAEIRRGVA